MSALPLAVVLQLIASCAPTVAPSTMASALRTESSFDPNKLHVNARPVVQRLFADGAKRVFVFSGSDAASRVAVCEAAIEALSLSAIDCADADTAYVSTGGGWGEAGSAAISQLFSKARMVVAASDRGTGSDLLAGRLEDSARRHGISFERRRPTAKDWNEQLVGERHGDSLRQDDSAEGL